MRFKSINESLKQTWTLVNGMAHFQYVLKKQGSDI